MNEEPFIDEEKDLKPCPFCGGEATVSQGSKANDEPWWYIECCKCAGMAESVEDWNRRTPVAEQVEPKIMPAVWDGKIRFGSDCIVNGVEVKAGTIWQAGIELPQPHSKP